jgi:hypothetical protein
MAFQATKEQAMAQCPAQSASTKLKKTQASITKRLWIATFAIGLPDLPQHIHAPLRGNR